ncbi:hypothetical protein AB0E25_40005 [Streptomyces bobili]
MSDSHFFGMIDQPAAVMVRLIAEGLGPTWVRPPSGSRLEG